MALNTLKCNHLTPLRLKGLSDSKFWVIVGLCRGMCFTGGVVVVI